jgi:hypothetical protein
MSEFKGTPGPWRVEYIRNSDSEISEIYISNGAGCILCVNDGDDNYDIEGDLANANLIATAPEMLAELQRLYKRDGARATLDIINKALGKENQANG